MAWSTMGRTRPTLLATALTLSCASGALRAEEGRDFSGCYEVVELADLGERVEITLRLELFNHTGSAVFDATVRLDAMVPLEDPVLSGDALAFLSPVSVPLEGVRIESTVVVPRWELDSWAQGAAPWLSVDFVDSSGESQRRPVELVAMPLGEVE